MKNKFYIILSAAMIGLCCCLPVCSYAGTVKSAGGSAAEKSGSAQIMRVEKDGTVIVNTTSLCKDVIGFQAQTPVEIYIKGGKVSGIKALQNSETPQFFEQAAAVLGSWTGLTPAKGYSKKVDAVSGATYSSTALIENVRRGLKYASENKKN